MNWFRKTKPEIPIGSFKVMKRGEFYWLCQYNNVGWRALPESFSDNYETVEKYMKALGKPAEEVGFFPANAGLGE